MVRICFTFKHTILWGEDLDIFLGHLVFYYMISMLVLYNSTLRNLHDVHLAEWAKVQTQIIRATDAAPDLLSLNLVAGHSSHTMHGLVFLPLVAYDIPNPQ